ncbi:MAG: TIGR02647 family protein [Gammaproteobacteria bacterium]|nr:TIGR02647 family protein [Gammaproteobacteria bacterium]
MRYSNELVNELNLLLHYNSESNLEGIKVHHTASESLITATQRLHEKGLVTQVDGGYLTAIGREAVGHAKSLLMLLEEPVALESAL